MYPGQSLISGQVLRSEDNKFELRLNNEGGLFIWDNEKDIFYRGIEDDVGNSGPYQLFVNVDCTFVLKSSDGFIQRSYGKSEKSVCFLYLQNNKELV